ncbi:uncharacterized protein YALI1_F15847g [Yarrowia lipolytica]|uniref:Uncharacterized protein n=1 Tax=Yarrowia lipolytica TaxID=4952 RepID=A0A1D8NN35_YARLL|nr:hypothetical protein YALI1_F15847g [Yarrowia lipolytica]
MLCTPLNCRDRVSKSDDNWLITRRKPTLKITPKNPSKPAKRAGHLPPTPPPVTPSCYESDIHLWSKRSCQPLAHEAR